MTEQEIANAIRERIHSVPGAPPIVVENASGIWSNDQQKFVTPDPLFWRAYQVKTPPERVGPPSDRHNMQGRFVVAVLGPLGEFSDEVETSAETIVAHFPCDLEILAGDGKAKIIQRAYYAAPFVDDAYWRANVHIRWRAEK